MQTPQGPCILGVLCKFWTASDKRRICAVKHFEPMGQSSPLPCVGGED